MTGLAARGIDTLVFPAPDERLIHTAYDGSSRRGRQRWLFLTYIAPDGVSGDILLNRRIDGSL